MAALLVDAACPRTTPRWTPGRIAELEDRWFSLQRHGGIAAGMGMSIRAVASRAHRLQLPTRTGFVLFPDYDPARRDRFAHLFTGWERRRCRHTGQPFWCRPGLGIRYSEDARRYAESLRL